MVVDDEYTPGVEDEDEPSFSHHSRGSILVDSMASPAPMHIPKVSDEAKRAIQAKSVQFEQDMVTAADMDDESEGSRIDALRHVVLELGNPAAVPATPDGARYNFRRNRAPPDRLEQSGYVRLFIGNLEPSLVESLLNEEGLSMDDSVDSEGDDRSEGIKFGDYIAGIQSLVARHGLIVRIFDPDERGKDHWAIADRGINYEDGLAKCIFCHRNSSPLSDNGGKRIGSIVECPSCKMPFHGYCAGLNGRSDEATAHGLCGQCEKFATIENAVWQRSRFI